LELWPVDELRRSLPAKMRQHRAIPHCHAHVVVRESRIPILVARVAADLPLVLREQGKIAFPYSSKVRPTSSVEDIRRALSGVHVRVDDGHLVKLAKSRECRLLLEDR